MSKTRRQIAERVSIACNIDMQEAKDILDSILEQMSDALAAGEEIKLANFGSFQVRPSPERMGRNPKTGEPAVIAARHRIAFKPSRTLVARLKDPS
jgi:integration host factor subunit alpha